MRDLKIYITTILFCLSSLVFSQEVPQEKTEEYEKWTVGLGIGVDHSVLGFRFSYYFNERLGVFTSLGLNQFQKTTPVLGLEYRSPDIIKDRLEGFVIATVGRDIRVDVFHVVSRIPLEVIEETKLFNSANIGGGLRLKFKKIPHAKFVLGACYRFVNSDKLEAFIDDFNDATGGSRQYTGIRRMLPIMGVTFDLGYLLSKER